MEFLKLHIFPNPDLFFNFVAKIQASSKISKSQIQSMHEDLLTQIDKAIGDVKVKLEQQKAAEEQERLRKIQEELERERKRKEEEEKRQKEAENDKRLKAEMEARRKEEEKLNDQLEADRRAARELQEKLNEENRRLREQIGKLHIKKSIIFNHVVKDSKHELSETRVFYWYFMQLQLIFQFR